MNRRNTRAYSSPYLVFLQSEQPQMGLFVFSYNKYMIKKEAFVERHWSRIAYLPTVMDSLRMRDAVHSVTTWQGRQQRLYSKVQRCMHRYVRTRAKASTDASITLYDSRCGSFCFFAISLTTRSNSASAASGSWRGRGSRCSGASYATRHA